MNETIMARVLSEVKSNFFMNYPFQNILNVHSKYISKVYLSNTF
ncbi:hypothetical protein VIBNISFn118_120030 [Vibrio nigripulchritudo SFn118]|nr:hypothetical protein VIBNISFn118_120030 [Vibrio nigripulchritudo SFn118]